MSVSAIATSSNLLDYNPQSVQNSRMQQFRKEFQLLGQDLQSGNLSAAETDFTALQQLQPQPNANPSAQGGNPLAQQFQQLSQELQSGNLSTAQQGYTNIVQAFHSLSALFHRHPHQASGTDSAAGTAATSQIDHLLTQLGQALQSGSLSASQQACSSLQQDLLQFVPAGATASGASSSGSGSISVSA